MTDIFSEIDEDLRRERMRRLWDRFGIYFILLVVLIIAGTGAYSGYRWWSQNKAQAAGAQFEAAVKLAEDGKHQEAEAAFTAIAKDAPAGYRTLARFRAASELALRDKAEAVKAFDALAADSSLTVPERDLARIRAGLLLVDTGSLDDVKQRVQQVADSQSPMRQAARELLALSQFKSGDLKAANATASAIVEDQEAPGGVRSRAQLLRTLTAPAPMNPAPASGGAVAPAATTAPAPGASPTQ
ncbi:tetratricopeptide repeat protein [Xanthobacteraceae bacterium A53D]